MVLGVMPVVALEEEQDLVSARELVLELVQVVEVVKVSNLPYLLQKKQFIIYVIDLRNKIPVNDEVGTKRKVADFKKVTVFFTKINYIQKCNGNVQ